MYLIVVIDDFDKWQCNPDIVPTLRQALDSFERMADGTVPELHVVMYELKQKSITAGRMEE